MALFGIIKHNSCGEVVLPGALFNARELLRLTNLLRGLKIHRLGAWVGGL